MPIIHPDIWETHMTRDEKQGLSSKGTVNVATAIISVFSAGFFLLVAAIFTTNGTALLLTMLIGAMATAVLTHHGLMNVFEESATKGDVSRNEGPHHDDSEDATTRLAELQGSISEAESELARYQNAVSSVRAELASTEKELRAQRDRIAGEKAGWQSEETAHKARMEGLQQEEGRAADEVAELERRVTAAEAQKGARPVEIIASDVAPTVVCRDSAPDASADQEAIGEVPHKKTHEKPHEKPTKAKRSRSATRRSSSGTSSYELALYYYVRQFFHDALHRYQYQTDDGNRYEADVYIPSINVAIEYDGGYWHASKKRVARDELKNRVFNNAGMYVIRVRDAGLPRLEKFDGEVIVHGKPPKYLPSNMFVTRVIHDLARFCEEPLRGRLEAFDLTYLQYVGDAPHYEGPLFMDTKNPNLTDYTAYRFWDAARNEGLDPTRLDGSTSASAWFRCAAGRELIFNVKGLGLSDRMLVGSDERDWDICNTCPFLPHTDVTYLNITACANSCSLVARAMEDIVHRYMTQDGDVSLDWTTIYEITYQMHAAFIAIRDYMDDMTRRQGRFEALFDSGMGIGRYLEIGTSEDLECLRHFNDRDRLRFMRFNWWVLDTDADRSKIVEFVEHLLVRDLRDSDAYARAKVAGEASESVTDTDRWINTDEARELCSWRTSGFILINHLFGPWNPGEYPMNLDLRNRKPSPQLRDSLDSVFDKYGMKHEWNDGYLTSDLGAYTCAFWKGDLALGQGF